MNRSIFYQSIFLVFITCKVFSTQVLSDDAVSFAITDISSDMVFYISQSMDIKTLCNFNQTNQYIHTYSQKVKERIFFDSISRIDYEFTLTENSSEIEKIYALRQIGFFYKPLYFCNKDIDSNDKNFFKQYKLYLQVEEDHDDLGYNIFSLNKELLIKNFGEKNIGLINKITEVMVIRWNEANFDKFINKQYTIGNHNKIYYYLLLLNYDYLFEKDYESLTKEGKKLLSSTYDKNGNNLLVWAIKKNELSIVKNIINENKEMINLQNKYGETALYFTLKDNMIDLAYELLCAGADSSIKDNKNKEIRLYFSAEFMDALILNKLSK